MLKSKKTFIALILASVFLLASCGVVSSSPSPPESAKEKPVISFTIPYWTTEVPYHKETNEAISKITGYDFTVNWIPSTAWEDKINTILASDSLTMVTVFQDLKSVPYFNAVDDGLLWQLDNYYKEYCPNLLQLGEARFDNVRRNGHLMGLPRARELVRQGVIYRRDWAEELGITQPKTTEDIETLVRGFAQRAGVKFGVVGTATTNVAYFVDFLAIFMGAPNQYGYNSKGEFTHAWLTDEYLAAADLYRQWYSEGLLNKDFVEGVRAEDYINLEEAGLLFAYCDNLYGRYSDLAAKNPDAKLWFAHQINGRAIATAGSNGALGFSTTAIKDEETLKCCLSFINSMGTVESETFLDTGVEGIHYTLSSDGYVERTQEQNDLYEATVVGYNQLRCVESVVSGNAKFRDDASPYDPFMGEERRALAKSPGLVVNLSNPFASDTLIKTGADISPIIPDTVHKYIMGVISKSEYEAAQKKWLDLGGAKVIEEFKVQVEGK